MEKLKLQIGNKTKEFKVVKQKTVSRIFYVPVTSDLEGMELWYRQWFPAFDNILNSIYCWQKLSAVSGREELKKKIGQDWKNSMAASTLKDLTAAGYRLLDASSQVIFLIDLTNPGSLEKIYETKEIFDELIKSWGGHLSFHFSCIAILRNYDEKSGEIMPPVDFEGFQEWSRNNLDRLFVVDIFNARSTTISNPLDLLYFVGQLVYFITRKPIEFFKSGESSAFHEWMKKIDPQKDRASSFSAISIVFPIDYILEICLVRKGAQTIEKVLFSPPSENRDKYYIDSLLGENSLQSANTFKHKITTGKFKELLVDPVDILGKEIEKYDAKSYFDDISHRVGLYKITDSTLPELAEKNKVLFQSQLSNITGDFAFTLQNQIDKIIAEENGSARILNSFFAGLKKHLSAFNTEKKSAAPPDNPEKLVKKLEEELEKVPSIGAMLAWGALFLITFVLNVLAFLKSPGTLKIISACLLLVLTGSMIFQWYAIKSRISKLCLRIESAIKGKWDLLMEAIINEFIIQVRDSCSIKYSESEKEIISILERFREIVHYGKEVYDTDPPVESAFWINAISKRDEASFYTEKISDKKNLKPVNILGGKPIIEFLNRISFNSQEDLNQFELELLENVALEFLPECTSILQLSVCDVLGNNKERLNNLKELVSNYSDPFISLNSLHIPEKYHRTLELPWKSCEEIADIFIRSFDSDAVIEKKESETTFRITLITFAEGIDINLIASSLNP